METDKDEEESMKTESFLPAKPSTSRALKLPPNVTKMCKWMHKIHLKRPVQVVTQLPLMCHWQFGLEEKEFQLRSCQNFTMKMGLHIQVIISHHSQSSVLESNYNLQIP